MRWGENRTRGRLSLICAAVFIFSIIMIGVFAEPTEDNPQLTAGVSVEETEASSETVAKDNKEGTLKEEVQLEEVQTTNNNEVTIEKADNAETSEKIESNNTVATAAPAPTGNMIVHYIDVGQGDATLLQGPDFTILIDAGRHTQNDVVSYLKSVGINELDLIVGTHPHADHIGQIDKVIKEISVKEVWMSGDPHTSQTFERVLDAILSSDANYVEPRAGEVYDIGSLRIEVVNPDKINGNLHEGSISLRAVYGEVRFMFTGDAEKQTEEAMLNRNYDLKSDIFQLGHHGSSTSNTKAFLDVVQPKVAIYSAGSGNSYGHPHDEVIQRLKDMKITIYGTNTHGTIKVTTDGKTYNVSTAKIGSIGVQTTTTSTIEPKKEESVPTPIPKPVAACEVGTVAINFAGVEELKEIHQISDNRANQIIDLRKTSPFTTYKSLERISGVGAVLSTQIEEQGIICFD